MENKKCCCIKTILQNTGKDVKLAYILIVILFISQISLIFCKGCFDKKVAKWIDNNPKAILESVQKFVEKEQAEAQKKQSETAEAFIKDNMNLITDTKNSGVINPKGNKTVVVFFDYNCGYCKMASKSVETVSKDDKNVKIIFRELPIFGGISETAAQYSTAVSIVEPNKFGTFHSNLFNGDTKTLSGIKAALKKSNISVDDVEKVLKNKKDEIEKRINLNKEIAQNLGLQGTPAFVINGKLIPGFVDAEQMKNLLK